eukprot:1489202-Pyramimonas_sp.AAC.1
MSTSPTYLGAPVRTSSSSLDSGKSNGVTMVSLPVIMFVFVSLVPDEARGGTHSMNAMAALT